MNVHSEKARVSRRTLLTATAGATFCFPGSGIVVYSLTGCCVASATG